MEDIKFNKEQISNNELITYNDSELLVLIKEVNPISEKAFEILWHRYASIVRQYCYYKVGNKEDAEDLFQNTWIEFYKSTKKNNRINSIKHYLLSIAYFNHCIMIKKHSVDSQRINIIDLEGHIDNYINTEKDYEDKELLLQLHSALNILDEYTKECVILRWENELSYKEIAEIHNDTPEAIRKRYCRAMKKIINYLYCLNYI